MFLSSSDRFSLPGFRLPAPDALAELHRYDAFDWCILVPYFAVLITLSIYGFYRYVVLIQYWRQPKKSSESGMPASELLPLPRVTIQLPIYNERYVVERLLEAVTAIEYPKDRLQIQVLDDSTDDTTSLAARLAALYERQGVPIEYRHRSDRTGFKAGALQDGLESATGELIAIFDADFLPPRDFLHRTVAFFNDPSVGVVQTRWSFENLRENLLTEVQGLLLDAHFALEHEARYRQRAFFNFNGTGGILRRKMIEDAGGWQHDTLTEDADLSYRAQLRGWRFVYEHTIECPSELPADMRSFQVQQFRWAKGLTQVAVKLLPKILRAPIPLRQKVETFIYLTPNVCYPLTVVLSALVVPATIVRFSVGWFQMLTVDVPLIATSFLPICIFYVLAAREVHPHKWSRAILLLPVLMAVGIGLAISNTKAFCEAVLGVQTEFVRTPKFAAQGRVSVPKRDQAWRVDWVLAIEFGLGIYFAGALVFELSRANYGCVPFLMLFLAGFLGTSLSTLYQRTRDSIWRKRLNVGAWVHAKGH